MTLNILYQQIIKRQLYSFENQWSEQEKCHFSVPRVRLSRRRNSRESEMFSRRSNMDKLPFSPPPKMKTALLHISHILQTPHGFRISNFYKGKRKGEGNKSKRHFKNHSREFRPVKNDLKLNSFPNKTLFLLRMRSDHWETF